MLNFDLVLFKLHKKLKGNQINIKSSAVVNCFYKI